MSSVIQEQQELFFRADKLVKKAEDYILNFEGESLFCYEENDSDDDCCGGYISCRSAPKSDEYAQFVHQVTNVVILDSKFLGYYNRDDHLSAVFIKAELTFKEWERECAEEFTEWDEIKNYVLWFEGYDTFSDPYEFAEKDIDGWPEEFNWLEEELEVEQ